MSFAAALGSWLSRTTPVFGLRLWWLITIAVGVLIAALLLILSIWMSSQKKRNAKRARSAPWPIPAESKVISIDRASAGAGTEELAPDDSGVPLVAHETYADFRTPSLPVSRSMDTENLSQCSSAYNVDMNGSSYSGDSGPTQKHSGPSPLIGLPEFSHLGWGHWFTLRDLDVATNHFAKRNVIGEGGYGIVYRGLLANGTEVAVKKLINNLGQAEKEFRVEVEAIGHVRHKNLVRLLGYCVEGTNRMLVYEFVNNGNLEQWLHGEMQTSNAMSWKNRIKVLLGTAKAIAYLHEAIEPKVVHRDIKSSNILIDDEFNSKVSDFGLAKLLNSDKSFVNTRVMGTYGYVAPEYANTGMLNEKSDIYSFGVLLLETVTGRDPVDYSRPRDEVNLVEWLKVMVATKRVDEVLDPSLDAKPATRVLKRAILIALRCVDPDADNRPKMSHVVQMFEAIQSLQQEEDKSRSHRAIDVESLIERPNN